MLTSKALSRALLAYRPRTSTNMLTLARMFKSALNTTQAKVAKAEQVFASPFEPQPASQPFMDKEPIQIEPNKTNKKPATVAAATKAQPQTVDGKKARSEKFSMISNEDIQMFSSLIGEENVLVCPDEVSGFVVDVTRKY